MDPLQEHDPARGERIKKAMERRGLTTAAALARETGAHRSTAGRWLEGGPLESPSLARLAAVLGTTREWILYEDPTSPDAPPPGELDAVWEEVTRVRSQFLEGLSALAKESAEQQKALEGLLSRVEQLEQTGAGSGS